MDAKIWENVQCIKLGISFMVTMLNQKDYAMRHEKPCINTSLPYPMKVKPSTMEIGLIKKESQSVRATMGFVLLFSKLYVPMKNHKSTIHRSNKKVISHRDDPFKVLHISLDPYYYSHYN